jgi:hypothetical protein
MVGALKSYRIGERFISSRAYDQVIFPCMHNLSNGKHLAHFRLTPSIERRFEVQKYPVFSVGLLSWRA